MFLVHPVLPFAVEIFAVTTQIDNILALWSERAQSYAAQQNTFAEVSSLKRGDLIQVPFQGASRPAKVVSNFVHSKKRIEIQILKPYKKLYLTEGSEFHMQSGGGFSKVYCDNFQLGGCEKALPTILHIFNVAEQAGWRFHSKIDNNRRGYLYLFHSTTAAATVPALPYKVPSAIPVASSASLAIKSGSSSANLPVAEGVPLL